MLDILVVYSSQTETKRPAKRYDQNYRQEIERPAYDSFHLMSEPFLILHRWILVQA